MLCLLSPSFSPRLRSTANASYATSLDGDGAILRLELPPTSEQLLCVTPHTHTLNGDLFFGRD